MKAVTLQNDVAVVDRKKCIGCGLCVTGCESKVALLQLKPENERIEPPKDYDDWENQRMINRGLLPSA